MVAMGVGLMNRRIQDAKKKEMEDSQFSSWTGRERSDRSCDAELPECFTARTAECNSARGERNDYESLSSRTARTVDCSSSRTMDPLETARIEDEESPRESPRESSREPDHQNFHTSNPILSSGADSGDSPEMSYFESSNSVFPSDTTITVENLLGELSNE
jgi:hypothetical protein